MARSRNACRVAKFSRMSKAIAIELILPKRTGLAITEIFMHTIKYKTALKKHSIARKE